MVYVWVRMQYLVMPVRFLTFCVRFYVSGIAQYESVLFELHTNKEESLFLQVHRNNNDLPLQGLSRGSDESAINSEQRILRVVIADASGRGIHIKLDHHHHYDFVSRCRYIGAVGSFSEKPEVTTPRETKHEMKMKSKNRLKWPLWTTTTAQLTSLNIDIAASLKYHGEFGIGRAQAMRLLLHRRRSGSAICVTAGAADDDGDDPSLCLSVHVSTEKSTAVHGSDQTSGRFVRHQSNATTIR